MKEEMLIEVIKTTITGEEHLGDNLKKQCIEYINNLQSQLKAKEEENEQLKDRINKAIEYMKPRFMNCIDNDKRYFEDNDIQEIYEILKEDNKEKVDE